jgi:hypothetical protein
MSTAARCNAFAGAISAASADNRVIIRQIFGIALRLWHLR